jgi:hypothetical protein
MRDERNRIIRLSLIRAGACAVVIIAALIVLYHMHMHEARERPVVVARSEAELMSAVTRYSKGASKSPRDRNDAFDPCEALRRRAKLQWAFSVSIASVPSL